MSTISEESSALFHHLCDQKLTTAAAPEGPNTAWRLKHLSGVDDPRLVFLFGDAIPSAWARHIELELNHRRAKKKKCVLVGVAYVIRHHFKLQRLCCTGRRKFRLRNAHVGGSGHDHGDAGCDCSHCHKGRAFRETVSALLGLKPVLDGINIIFSILARHGAAMESEEAFGYIRCVETSTESIPFVIIQDTIICVTMKSLCYVIAPQNGIIVTHILISDRNVFFFGKKSRLRYLLDQAHMLVKEICC